MTHDELRRPPCLLLGRGGARSRRARRRGGPRRPRATGWSANSRPNVRIAGHVLDGEDGPDAGRREGRGGVDRRRSARAASGFGPWRRTASPRRAGRSRTRTRPGPSAARRPAAPSGRRPRSRRSGHRSIDPAHRSLPRSRARPGTAAIRRATRWPSAAIASSSTFASRPSATTRRPSTNRSRTRSGRQCSSAATGSASAPANPQAPHVEQRDVGALARFDRTDVVVAAEARRPAARRQPERVAVRQRRRVAARPGDQHRLARLGQQVPGVVRRRTVDAQPDGRARVQQIARPARCPTRAGGSTSGSARPPSRSRASVATSASERWTQWASHTSGAEVSRGRPAGRAAARRTVSRQNRSSSTVSAMCVCSRTPRERASAADSRIRSRRDRERRARRDGDPHHRARRGSWSRRSPPPSRPGVVGAFDHLVRREAAGRRAEVHRAPARVEPHPDRARRFDLRVEQPAGPAREDVVVVGRRRTSRQREFGEARPWRRRAPTPSSRPAHTGYSSVSQPNSPRPRARTRVIVWYR